MQNEAELLEGLKNGSEQAYKQLFTNYFEPLTYFANKYLADIEASQDLVQEVFTKVYEKRSSLHITLSLKSFLYRSIANASLNEIKHQKVKQRHHDVILDRATKEVTDQQIETAELELKIQRSIDSLPPQCARIFKMSRFEEMSNQEIADTLNISKRTVETQISKALKSLHKVLYFIFLQLILKNF